MKSGSDVVLLADVSGWRHRALVHQNLFAACEGDEDASRGLGINLAGKGCLASADRGLLLRAVAAPVGGELVGVSDGVELARPAEVDPDANRLEEGLGKQVFLPASGYGGGGGGVRRQDRRPRRHIVQNSGRTGKAGECLAGRGNHKHPFEGAATGAERRVVNRPSSFPRPFVEKFERVLHAGYLPDAFLFVFDENGNVEQVVVHLILHDRCVEPFGSTPIRRRYVYRSPGRQELGEVHLASANLARRFYGVDVMT